MDLLLGRNRVEPAQQIKREQSDGELFQGDLLVFINIEAVDNRINESRRYLQWVTTIKK